MFPKKGVKTFTLPTQDFQATEFMNKENIVITHRETHFSAKECMLFLHIQYDDYTPQDDESEDENESGCLLDA